MEGILWHRTLINTDLHLIPEEEGCIMMELIHKAKDCSLAVEWQEKSAIWSVSLMPIGNKDPNLGFLDKMLNDSFASFVKIPPHHTGIMKILTWNCRGAGSKEFRRHIKELILNHKPEIVVLIETKVQVQKALKIINKIGLKGSIQSPPNGRSGGIWILWNCDLVDVQCYVKDSNVIHAVVIEKEKEDWMLSACYARPDPMKKAELWSNLNNLSEVMDIPWLVVGDFIEIAARNEKVGGRSPSSSRIQNFNNNINNCGLVDLGFVGPAFTWSNHRDGITNIQQRLDRCLANSDWRILFNEAEKTPQWVSWNPPDLTSHIINTDASCINANEEGIGRIAIGGVFRDKEGRWIRGFVGFKGMNNIFVGELLAIKEAMFMAKEYGLTDLEIETDSLGAVMAIQSTLERVPEEAKPIVEDIKNMKNGFFRIFIGWRPREANRAADAMARLGQEMQNPGVIRVEEPPSEVETILSEDLRGLSIPRF